MKTEVAEAERLSHEHMGSCPAGERTLSETVGAVLRETVQAERDQPPFDRVTMDGIAISYADWENGQRRYRVIGTQGAGAPPLKVDRAGDCVEIMTGMSSHAAWQYWPTAYTAARPMPPAREAADIPSRHSTPCR